MSAAQWVGLILQASIMLTVLGLGLTATWQQATYLIRTPALLLRAVVSMSVAMPIVVVLIAWTFDLPVEVKVSLVALAMSPVPPLIQKKQLAAGGRMEYVVGLLVAMSVVATVLVPSTLLVLDWMFDRTAAVSPLVVLKIMVTTVFAPLVVGLVLKRWLTHPEKVSGIVMAIAGLLLLGSAGILLFSLRMIVFSFLRDGTLVALIAVALIGLCIGHVLGGPLASDRTALAISTASRHPAIALAVATSGSVGALDKKPELAIILLYLIVATVVAIPYQKWRNRPGVAPAGSTVSR